MPITFLFEKNKTLETSIEYYVEMPNNKENKKFSITFTAENGSEFSVKSDCSKLEISYDRTKLSIAHKDDYAKTFMEKAEKHLDIRRSEVDYSSEMAPISAPYYWLKQKIRSQPMKDSTYEVRGRVLLKCLADIFNDLQTDKAFPKKDKRIITEITKSLNKSFAPTSPDLANNNSWSKTTGSSNENKVSKNNYSYS